jgi:hypothetical protein
VSREARTTLRQALRQFLLGSGSLKRGSDRVQMMGRVVVVLSFLVSGPVAVAAATATTHRMEAVAAAQAAERSQVPATVLEDAALAPGWGATDAAPPEVVFVQASWSAGGQLQEGKAPVAVGTRAGAVVSIWVGGNGVPTRAPLDRDAVSRSVMTASAMALIGVPVAGFCLYAMLCVALDAHRTRRWEQEWGAVEPRWSSEQLN